MVQDDEPVGLDGAAGRVRRRAGRVGRWDRAGRDARERLGIEALVERFVVLRRDRPGAANAGRKVMALIYAMVLGADSIDDCERAARGSHAPAVSGGWLPAPSTLGTFLRAFTFGHVRQLDRLLGETLARAWLAGAGPGEEPSGDRR